MATKTIDIPDVGPVTLVKSARSKQVRLSITSTGIRVSLPTWTPYAVGQAFALHHTDWIKRHMPAASASELPEGKRVGRFHTLHYEKVAVSAQPRAKVMGSKIIVQMHPHESASDTAVQDRAKKVSQRALKKEADQVLPNRLKQLAATHGFRYASVSSRQLKRRWGSCDSHRQIVLNYYLMELPWDCIDYVLLHELTHTEHMNHGEGFWKRLKEVCPRALDIRKQMRQYQPMLRADNGSGM